MTKAYAILELDVQYNDEYYYNTDNGGGTPLKVFKNKKNAEKYLKAMTELKIGIEDCNPWEFNAEGELMNLNSKTKKEIKKIADKDDNEIFGDSGDNPGLFSTLSTKDKAKVWMGCEGIAQFYSICEVEVED